MKFLFIPIILFTLLYGCQQKTKPDISNLLKERNIHRFDQDLFALHSDTPNVEILRNKYGVFFNLYSEGILQLGKNNAPEFRDLLSIFLRDSIIREVYDSVAITYPRMEAQNKEFSQAWAYYAYYFPGKIIPEVYSYISGFNQSIVVDSNIIGISLENYLGEECRFYSMLAVPIPMYARRNMTADHIVKDALYGWLSSEFLYIPEKNDLISGMIYQGKMTWLLEKIFPDAPLSKILDFTDEQMKWCVNNEEQIWKFLIENDYLFSTQQSLIMKYLNHAPFTSGMPVESPGKAVVWSGYRIVDQYMKRSKASIQDLANEQDYHKILRIAGYRP